MPLHFRPAPRAGRAYLVDQAVARRRLELRHAKVATGTAPCEELAKPTPKTLCASEYEDRLKREGVQLIVHIAGKGNLPSGAELGEGYNEYKKNWPEDRSPAEQVAIKALLTAEQAGADFDELVAMVAAELGAAADATLSKAVFTFDGDNFQENSPFTFGIKRLIERNLNVYAFKQAGTEQAKLEKHFKTWSADGVPPYSGLVLTDAAPKKYTSQKYDWYLSYGMPLFRSREIRQPQKDKEIFRPVSATDPTLTEEVFEDGDQFRRKVIDPHRPGLVQSSMVTEYEDLQKVGTRKDVFPFAHGAEHRATLVVRA